MPIPAIESESTQMRGGSLAKVPSDGRPYRVPIFQFDGDARCEWVLISELASSVLLKSVQDNRASHPILAGPVDSIRHCGLVGRTSIGYIAPGETFPLGWGPDAAMRVHREHSDHEPKKSLISSWHKREHHISIYVSNIGPEPRT